MNNQRVWWALAFAVLMVPLTTRTVRSEPGQSFEVGCTLPFDGLQHEIDNQCPRDGDPMGTPEGKAQNRFKTNFCASDPAIEVTKAAFGRSPLTPAAGHPVTPRATQT